jgi:hypothetical protein
MFICKILCAYCLLPAQFCYKIVYIWKFESRAQIVDRFAPSSWLSSRPPQHGPHIKHSSSSVVSGFAATEMCLPRRCVVTVAAQITENTVPVFLTIVTLVCVAARMYSQSPYLETALAYSPISQSLHSNGCTHYNMKNLYELSHVSGPSVWLSGSSSSHCRAK